jgi:predicted acetyltransferase
VLNGEIDGYRCIAVGYAVSQDERNKGHAKQVLREVVIDLVLQARMNGAEAIYIEAVVDVTNLPSQRVAEAILNMEREEFIDSNSGRPAYRYTARYECN